jgi:crotonobetainyl-CoA:carnitine CoA-transferase CaiB-like acyl-CoA transferase
MSRLFYDEAMSNAAPPLDGLVALDFTHALAGPYCTMLMATYGGNVVEVEEPEHGDIGRAWGPPFQGSDSAYFVGLNSGKKSLAIDLKTPEGLEHCRALAAIADILIENFRPGACRSGFPIRPDRCAAPHHCSEPMARRCCATCLVRARARVPVTVK